MKRLTPTDVRVIQALRVLASLFVLVLAGTACGGGDREFEPVLLQEPEQEPTVITEPEQESSVVTEIERSDEPLQSAELRWDIRGYCDNPSLVIDGQDAGSHGGFRVEPSDGVSLSLWSSFGDVGVEVPLGETGQPGTVLATVSESGYRLTSNDAKFEAVDVGWYVSGTLASAEGDVYPFESCLVPEATGTWLYESFDDTGVSHAGWEMFDLVTSFEWVGDARDQSELGEYERIEVDQLIAFGDGFEAQEGFQLVQRIADGFNESQAGDDAEFQQHASSLFHTWGAVPVSYLRVTGGGDDAIEASVIRFEMTADAELGWVVGNVSTRAVCRRGLSDGFCI